MHNFSAKLSGDGNLIHSTAIVSKNAKLGRNNFIGAYCIIEDNVIIGDNNRFESHVCIGARPQHTSFSGEVQNVIIGSNNTFREFTVVHAGMKEPTEIGSFNYFMNYVHIPHDCLIGNHVTIANNVQIAGHTSISDYCNIGLSATIHQFSILGEGCMIGMGAVIPKGKRILPYKTYVGNPVKELKDNQYLIDKLNIPLARILDLRKIYNAVFNERFLKKP